MARFSESQHELFQRLNASIAYDIRLAAYDLRQSRAHVRMLGRCGILAPEDVRAIEDGLAQLQDEWDAGRFEVRPDDEDVHMAIERRLTEIVGPVGGKLHTARSRNDQVATDLALFVRDHAEEAVRRLAALMEVVADLAERHLDWPMPGYTHLQRAQPVYLSHHLLAHFWRLRRDVGRFEACRAATDAMPLGAGALAGVNFPTDRRWLARELGFSRVAENSLDAVSNRDFVLDYLSAAAVCAVHLSQIGAEIVLWSSEEFGFCEVGDAFASGSSIMPQKKNPDAAELLRAKAPRAAAHLVGLLGVLHGLPLTYNKDLQEDKEHLFDAVDTLELCLRVTEEMLRGTTFRRERLAAASQDELLAATDVADHLVRRGVPFRESHGIVAGLVRRSLDTGRTLSQLTRHELAELAPALDEDYYGLLRQGAWLESKESEGGTALARVRDQLEQARAVLAEAR